MTPADIGDVKKIGLENVEKEAQEVSIDFFVIWKTNLYQSQGPNGLLRQIYQSFCKDPAKISPDNFSNFVRQSKKYDAFFPFSQNPNYKQREKTMEFS